MDENKTKALQAALAQIEKQFGKGSIMKMGEGNVSDDIQTVSTGSLGLDIALGIGGLPRGRVVEIYGPESSGKTTLCLHVVAEIQKAGGVAAYIDAENALDPAIRRQARRECARYADLATRHRRARAGDCRHAGALGRRGSGRDRLRCRTHPAR
jgi:protein RecA